MEAENAISLMTSNERITQGYDQIIAGLRQPAARQAKLTPGSIQRLLQPNSELAGVAAQGDPPTRGEKPLLTGASSHHSLTSASVINFPGIEGRLASRRSFQSLNGGLSPSKSSRNLRLMERNPSNQQVVDAMWPGQWHSTLSPAPFRPTLRLALEANSENAPRFFGGAWRHRVSRTPRSEEVATFR